LQVDKIKIKTKRNVRSASGVTGHTQDQRATSDREEHTLYSADKILSLSNLRQHRVNSTTIYLQWCHYLLLAWLS